MQSARAAGRAWGLAAASGLMAGAIALVLMVGNAYTLDIGQADPGADDAAPALKTIAPQGRVERAAWSSGPVAVAMPAGAALHPAHRSGAPHALLLSLQGVRDAVEPAEEASDGVEADAPGVLIPAAFEFSGSADAGSSADDGSFFAGGGNSGELGPPSGGGGFLSSPSGGGGGGVGAGGQAATTTSQGVQPLLAAPGVTGPAPEPSTWALLALGLGGVGAAMRGQRRRRAA
ncbi:MAG TPA: PEP-CTERM sorting domain-containing protein [Phenylobacterium sp.]|uniref:PEP-CTERM sorting domain-containing protein n=1 Tax=Phenylobacterium sp. TaxID=1871053 RepID=UPI002C9DE9A1|nr:PEP-CTERM sorting domain-containing protein [Phenylobacterium sp.]HXA38357.1 PEP-CTERM sorting domain-containing protein [Phenylobacterium sp.]